MTTTINNTIEPLIMEIVNTSHHISKLLFVLSKDIGVYVPGVMPHIQKEEISNPKHLMQSLSVNFYTSFFRPIILEGRDRTTIDIDRSNTVLRYEDTIKKYANAFGLPANVILGLIHVESSGVANIWADKGSKARGLGQFIPRTARGLGLRVDNMVDERTDPDKAIWAIGKHLSYLTNKYGGDMSKALVAYHEGENRAEKIFALADSGAGRQDTIEAMAANTETGQIELISYLSNVLALSSVYRR